MSAETCPVIVSRGDVWHSKSEPCGKPVKGTLPDGKGVCGVHLRSANIQAENEAAYGLWRGRVRALADQVGFNVYGGEPGAFVQVRLADLEALAARLKP